MYFPHLLASLVSSTFQNHPFVYSKSLKKDPGSNNSGWNKKKIKHSTQCFQENYKSLNYMT